MFKQLKYGLIYFFFLDGLPLFYASCYLTMHTKRLTLHDDEKTYTYSQKLCLEMRFKLAQK